MHRQRRRMEEVWTRRGPAAWALSPLAWLYCAIASARRQVYRWGLLASHRIPVPVVVVGNITVGGTGKTPLVIRLVEFLLTQGWRPGVVSRGYGGHHSRAPQRVTARSDPARVGDEPVLIAGRTRRPVVVDRDRARGAQALAQDFHCDVVISDDGLQHYALARDIEIAVMDGARGFGNGFCLPAGPLRERPARLQGVDMAVTNGTPGAEGGYAMQLRLGAPTQIGDRNRVRSWTSLENQTIHAVAGIGDPGRFFRDLRQLGMDCREHPFPDHWPYRREDFEFGDELPILMTEKDAVKCASFADERMWFVPASAELPESFFTHLQRRLQTSHDRSQTA